MVLSYFLIFIFDEFNDLFSVLNEIVIDLLFDND